MKPYHFTVPDHKKRSVFGRAFYSICSFWVRFLWMKVLEFFLFCFWR